jgi:hypothetical protein
MATANYSSWSGGNPPQQGPSTTATVVDTDPPESFSRWPNRQRLQPDPNAWPNKKPPQRRQRRPVSPTDGLALSAQKPRPVGRWIVVFSLWAFATGLSAAPALSFYGDRGVEATIKWMASWAPSSLRPYLPKPLEEPRPPVHQAKPSRSVVVEPSAPSEQPVEHPQARRAHGKHGSGAVPPTASATQATPAEKPVVDPFEQ